MSAGSEKKRAPVAQTQIAIQVVPQQAMQDQHATRLQEAILTNVSSMAAAPNGLSDNTNFTIRGFNSGTTGQHQGDQANSFAMPSKTLLRAMACAMQVRA